MPLNTNYTTLPWGCMPINWNSQFDVYNHHINTNTSQEQIVSSGSPQTRPALHVTSHCVWMSRHIIIKEGMRVESEISQSIIWVFVYRKHPVVHALSIQEICY